MSWSNSPVIFIHIPKNAGTSILSSMGMKEIGHYRYSDVNKLLLKGENRIFFSVVRDPVARVISTYYYAKKLKRKNGSTGLEFVAEFKTLEEFVQKGLNKNLIENHYFFWSQSRYLEGVPRSNLSLLNINSLARDFLFFQAENQLNYRGLEIHNVSSSDSVALSKESIAKIMDLYEDDYSNDLISKALNK